MRDTTLTVGSASFDDWLRTQRGALASAAESAYPGDVVEDADLARFAREIGHRHLVEVPTIQDGTAPIAVKLEDAKAPPRGVPRASDRGWVDDEVRLRVRVTVAVDGDVNLLALRPHGLQVRPGSPPMTVGTGCVWTTFPHPVTRSAVDLWVYDLRTAARLVAHQVNLFWNAGVVGQVLDAWRARRERERKIRLKVSRAESLLGHLGLPVERDT